MKGELYLKEILQYPQSRRNPAMRDTHKARSNQRSKDMVKLRALW
jgi:hypothetical protein